MQIGYLADHRDFIPTLAQWHHREWAYLRPGDSVEARITRLRDACGHTAIPTVVIALIDSTLIGSAMLVAHDMDTRMDLSPWLSSAACTNRTKASILSSNVAFLTDVI